MANSSKLKKAVKVEDIYSAFRYSPLQIDEMDEFFIETNSARGGKPMRKRVFRLLEQKIVGYHHFLFVGYQGCGKSTELNRLLKDIQDRYLVLNYSVFTELDPAHLNYIELFIVTLERLFAVARDNDLAISQEYIDKISHWLRTKEIVDIREKYNIGAEAEAGAEGKFGIPYLQNFFYKFRLSAKSSLSLKETIKQNIEPKLSDLIENCNLLINEIKIQLFEIGKDDLLIIIEDLDKIPVDRAEELFFYFASQIMQLKCNVLFTFPTSTYFNNRFNTVKQNFDEIYELPMIKVINPDQTEDSYGIEILVKIVEKRMDLSLFDDNGLLKLLILKSGGCIRDLFKMIAEAAEHSIDFGNTAISKLDCDISIQSLKREFDNTIADNFRNGKKIEVATYYNALVRLAKAQNKQFDNTEEILDLRSNRCVLSYNSIDDNKWCDVHPIVKEILIEKGKWDGRQDSSN